MKRLLLLPLLLPAACQHTQPAPATRTATVQSVSISEDMWEDGSTTIFEEIRCRYDDGGESVTIWNVDREHFGRHKPGQRVQLPAPPECELPIQVSPRP